MPPPQPNPFTEHPLTAPLLADKTYTTDETLSQDPFFRLTLHSNSTVHTTAFFYRKTPFPIGHLLLHIGPGTCGQADIAHGGFLAAILDEVCGTTIARTGLDGGGGMFTVQLGVGYKKPLRVSGGAEGTVIVATARLKRVEGRKIFVEGVVRDEGGVCTTAEAVFVKRMAEL
ncbi:HotDog domain-containing protein [Aspergillus californicus]